MKEEAELAAMEIELQIKRGGVFSRRKHEVQGVVR